MLTNAASLFIEPNIERLPWSGCWIWMNGDAKNRRHQLIYEGESILAYRLSYMAFVGELPDEVLACHRCDVPECVNPCHLFPGTHTENMRDMVKKGRHKGFGNSTDQPSLEQRLRGEANTQAKLTEDQVKEIRSLRGVESPKKLRERFGISKGHLYRIFNGQKWKHLT
jgi:hypothetical protein